MSIRLASRLAVFVMPPRRIVPPLECSDGTRPRYPIKRRGDSKLAEIAGGSDEGRRGDRIDAAQSAQGFHQWSQRPVRHHRGYLLDKSISPLLRGPDGLKVVMEDDTVRLLLEDLSCKPASMPLRPVLANRIGPAMPQQEGEQLLASAHQVHRRIHSRSHQIAKGFMCGVWNPDGRQVASAMEDRQLLRVAPVGLDPLAWLARNQ